ncbi:MAG: uracil-DNA glycosylase [Pseudomonadota bacterium]
MIPGDHGHPESPSKDCPLCPRLGDFLQKHRALEPEWHNAPVPSFGPAGAPLLIVGLAPGLRGANRTGRPFTGDYAGDLLYPTLLKFGLAEGEFAASPDDGLRPSKIRVTNAVRCVPPENKPVGAEVKACRPFLLGEIAGMTGLKAILCLGGLSHGAVLSALKLRKADYRFAHGAQHQIALPDGRAILLADSYHCSRYNTNTGRLTEEMFEQVFHALTKHL